MAGSNKLRALLKNGCRVGLGGEGVLRTEGKEQEALRMLNGAYDNGIRYYDSATAYAGSERYLGLFWKQHPERKEETFQTSKTACRDAKGASEALARTLTHLGREHLDLWQIHDLRTRVDLRRLKKADGALKVFYDACETGTVRGIGVTGHHNPAVLLDAVTSWDIDSVLLPVNPVEAILGGFIDPVIPAARERGIGVIGMKVLGAGHYLTPKLGLDPEILIQFALTQDVDMVIVGCSTPIEAELLARLGRDHKPMDEETLKRVIDTFRPYAKRLAYYRGVV
jgi:aryl-alcohol dehydrogenase-like predicted oxidoreductase